MKILIVEDEFNAREGLAAIIQRTCSRHTICGKAADGEEGLRLALSERPDLIFVDIELPKMNGLQMIKELLDRHIDSAFVILSGYAEFEYARQAIRYGVSEYLLKPITYDKLIHVIENMEKWKDALHGSQKRKIPKSELLKSVLSGRSDSGEALDSLNNIIVPKNLHLLNLYYRKDYDAEKIQFCLQTFCDSQRFENIFLSAFPEHRFFTALLNGENSTAKMECAVNYNLSFKLRQNGFTDITLSLLQINSPDDLLGRLDRVCNLNEWGLSLGNQQVLTEDKLPERSENFEKEANRIRQIDMEALSAVKNGEPKRLAELNRKLLETLAKEVCTPREFKNACAQYVLSVLVCYREFNVDAIEKVPKMQLFDTIRNCCTREEMLACLDQLIALYHNILPDQIQASSILVKKTVDYITHFYAGKVALEEIAAQLKVTPEYISHLFTKDIGISFSDYLKKYRIDMAKKIMQTSNDKMYQIGGKVGYKDPKYFNRMFKEVTGLSPKEYMKK